MPRIDTISLRIKLNIIKILEWKCHKNRIKISNCLEYPKPQKNKKRNFAEGLCPNFKKNSARNRKKIK